MQGDFRAKVSVVILLSLLLPLQAYFFSCPPHFSTRVIEERKSRYVLQPSSKPRLSDAQPASVGQDLLTGSGRRHRLHSIDGRMVVYRLSCMRCSGKV